jgi:hypothetical protein
MKKYNIASVILLTAILLVGSSCSDLLEENPKSNPVPAAFATPVGLLAGISGVYNDIRNAWGTEGFTLQQMAGTDEYLMGASAQNPRIFSYNGLTGSDFSGGFGMYSSINTLNGILELGPTTAGLTPEQLKAYLGQAQFLRAFLYFYLVQVYGNIPLNTKFITEPTLSATPADRTEVYALIVQDLNDAITNLPNTPTAPFLGKAATVAAAKWLLAKVYLTRGWLTNNTADFTLAYNTAKELIDNKATYGLDLWQNYEDAFHPNNDYGKETIFVSDHTNDPKYGYYTPGGQQAGGGAINVTPWMGLFNGPGEVGVNSTKNASGVLTNGGTIMLSRDVQFGRPFTRIRPNMPRLTTGPNTGLSYIYDRAFADRLNDSRYDKTFQTVWLANSTSAGGGNPGNPAYSGPSVTGTRGQLTAGLDTAVWFPDYEVVNAPQAVGSRPFKGIVVPPSLQKNTVYPYMKKYADPRRVHQNDPSYRPLVLARFSEVYLIAAEAAFKAGQLQNAADMLNVIRLRAAFRSGAPYTAGGAFGIAGAPRAQMVGDPYPAGITQPVAEAAMTITAGQVTLDFILDERTREFYGEGLRWLDLVRTQTLISRVQAWNPTEAGANIAEKHLLRPIPQDQIDRVTVGTPYPQNPGY